MQKTACTILQKRRFEQRIHFRHLVDRLRLAFGAGAGRQAFVARHLLVVAPSRTKYYVQQDEKVTINEAIEDVDAILLIRGLRPSWTSEKTLSNRESGWTTL